MNSSALRRLVFGLGIAQLVSWAALIYSIAVLGAPMAHDLGVSETAVFGAFSLSLAVSGLAAPRAGRLIDRVGGRRVLTLGSSFAAVSLAGIALAPTLLFFVLAWGFAGIARAMTLYEAAFATLSQHATGSFRKSVTAITLVGGFAGTVSFPLSLIGLEHLGWRGTLFAFAAAGCLLPAAILASPGFRSAHARAQPARRRHGRKQSVQAVVSWRWLSFALTASLLPRVRARHHF